MIRLASVKVLESAAFVNSSLTFSSQSEVLVGCFSVPQ